MALIRQTPTESAIEQSYRTAKGENENRHTLLELRRELQYMPDKRILQWHNKYNHQDNSTTAVAVVLLQSNHYLHALVWPT